MKRASIVSVVVILVAGFWWWRRQAPAPNAVPPVAASAPVTSEANPAAARHTVPTLLDAGTVAAVDPMDAAQALDCDAPDGDIVRVDGRGIAAGAFCAAWRSLTGPLAGSDAAVADKQGRALLDRMIDALLVTRALEATGRKVEEREVDAALRAIVARRVPTKEYPSLEQELRAQGTNLMRVRADLRQRLELERLVTLHGKPEPSDEEVERAHAADPTRFGVPRRARMEAFLARAASGASPHQQVEARARAQALARDLASGPPAEVAGRHGLTAVALEVTATSSEPAVVAAAFSLSPGEWSRPVGTRAGWMVMRLIAIDPGQARPLGEVREEVRQMLANQRKVTEPDRILAELRAKATIEYLQW